MTDTTSGVRPRRSRASRGKPCPLCGRKDHSARYRRRASERRKALLNDAANPKSDLSPTARRFILKHRGYRVPRGYEVSHEKPLYMEPRATRCTLDHAGNMKTQQKSVHRRRHKKCGDQFHKFKKKKKRKCRR